MQHPTPMRTHLQLPPLHSASGLDWPHPHLTQLTCTSLLLPAFLRLTGRLQSNRQQPPTRRTQPAAKASPAALPAPATTGPGSSPGGSGFCPALILTACWQAHSNHIAFGCNLPGLLNTPKPTLKGLTWASYTGAGPTGLGSIRVHRQSAIGGRVCCSPAETAAGTPAGRQPRASGHIKQHQHVWCCLCSEA